MFAYISGKLELIDENYIVIDVNGIGYKVFTSATTIERLPQLRNEVKVYTYLHLREDIMDLYGFVDREQLSTFELLLTVSGIGPKAALGVISTIPVSDFALAVISSDIKTITKAPGIGKKLAERIILELRDKIKSRESVLFQEQTVHSEPSGLKSEAVNALVALGYSPGEAARAVQAVNAEGMEVEEMIKRALKVLMK